jgi:hypothetical protein
MNRQGDTQRQSDSRRRGHGGLQPSVLPGIGDQTANAMDSARDVGDKQLGAAES